MSDPYVDTQASETGWMLESVAWTLDGQEVSRCAMGSRDGLHRWALANGEIGFAGEFSVTTNAEGVLQYSGSIYEGPSTLITGAILEPNTTSTQTPYTLTIGGMLEPSVGPLSELTLGHADLVAQWVPFYHDLAGLLDIAAPGDGGEVAGPGKCAAAGAMTAVGCLATASTVLFGYFVCDDIAEAGLDWCKD